jgi:hypothetical protein
MKTRTEWPFAAPATAIGEGITTKKDRLFSNASVWTSSVKDKKKINTCAHVSFHVERVLLQSEQVLFPFNFLYMFSEEAKLNFLSF